MDLALPGAGLWLMFLLGLRHGVDPDHIAMIDSMAYRSLSERARVAPWVGTLFALGHGLTVTAIAVALGAYAGDLAPVPAVHAILDWLPALLLLFVGTLNLRELLGRQAYRPRGWKTRFVPARLRDSSHPLAVVLVGVLFALVFDTATQAAAWGYAAASGSQGTMALLAGLAFTAGMVVTDTIDGRLVVHLLRRAAGRAAALRYRRRIGWLVVGMSYSIGAWEIGALLGVEAGPGELAMTAAGCLLVAAVPAACFVTRLRTRAGAPFIKEQV